MTDGIGIKNRLKEDYYVVIASLVLIGAFIVAALISFLSPFGMHPDEYDVRVCMDWCMDRFIWPDMRLYGEGLGDTYSGYGYTKVCNYTPYFLIFSKIAYVFKQFMQVFPYYRMPNLLLMFMIVAYCIKKIRRNNYLLLGFGVCIQAWYIFSYVTADAEDFLLSFFAIALLADEDSFLWKTLRSSTKETGCIVLGLLYGVMLLGKPNYYAILGFTFCVLVYRLIKTEFNKRPPLLRKYLIILCTALMILGARAGLDLHYYGLNKAEARYEMSVIYSDYDKNPTTPVEDRTHTYHMYEFGHKITDIFEYEPHWFLKIYRSFVDSRITAEGDEPYYAAMAVLYAAIYISIGIYLCRGSEAGIFILGTVFNVGSVLAAILSSYISEIQPQGRYLLPIALVTCYLGSRARGLWDKRYFKLIVLAAACLSIAYFGLNDTRDLIDLAYARELLGR